MAVAVDKIMSSGNGTGGLDQQVTGGTSVSAIVTATAAAKLIVGMLAAGRAGTTSISSIGFTWNAGAMTLGPNTTGNDASGAFATAIGTKASPATGALTVASSWTLASDAYLSAVSFTGTDTTTGINAAHSQTTATASVALSTTSDGATLANFVNNDGNPTITQTTIWVDSPLTPGGGGSYALGGSGTNKHTFTGGTQQYIAGIHIIAPAAGGAVGWGRLFAGDRNSRIIGND
jgi:hypothetical protein